MNKIYALHTSHSVKYGTLMQLYRLHPHQCIRWDEWDRKTWIGLNYDDYIHLGVVEDYGSLEDQQHLKVEYE